MVYGYNFSDRVRRVLQFAREESDRLRQGYVGPEHVLLGLLREGEGMGSNVLARTDVDPEKLRATVESGLKPGERKEPAGRPDLPYTSRAKAVLEATMAEAREMRHQYVGTEHLLLGLLRVPSTPAVAALASAGVTLERARTVALQLHGSEQPAGPEPPPFAASEREIAVGGEPLARWAFPLALLALAVAVAALVLSLRK